jgi:hypothetical protein
MTPAKLTAALLLALYLGAGVCFAVDRFADLNKTIPPPGQPTPLAKWAVPVKRDDPRPFLIRLLLSLRYDFYHKDIRGGADF